MKEINAIIDAYRKNQATQTRAALATVSRVEGSSYRRTGARMLVLENGQYIGGISGGCLEGDALRRAQKAIALKTPSVVTYDTTQDDDHQVGVGLGCNGVIDVLFTPIVAEQPNPIEILEQVADTRTPRVLLTITEGGHNKELLGTVLLYKDDPSFLQAFPLPGIAPEVLAHIKQGLKQMASQTTSYQVAGQPVQVFIEVLRPATQLVIYGGNYDIYPLVRIAAELGWHTTVVMNTAKADKSLFTTASKVLHNKGTEMPHIDDHTAVVLMAHDLVTDQQNLRTVLETKAAYIGLLGPKKRTLKMLDALAAEGIPLLPEEEQRIFSPAGLDIGAVTPEEIALAIVGEINSHFSGRPGSPLRNKQGTIHGNTAQ
jgi:xanthine/CO dehydrogenase XdhC/CoxF family maturation factor